MQLRQLRPDEGLAYRDVRLRSLREAPEAFASTHEEESQQPDDFWRDLIRRTAQSMEAAVFTVERDDGTLAATAFVRVSPAPPHDGYIGAMWLDADLRGAGDPSGAPGWADQLLAAAEHFARALGSESVGLWVSESNPRAQRFYERNGYRPTGLREPQPSGITASHLVKPVIGP